MTDAGALYECRVIHRRPGRPRYRFSYRVYCLLLDLDRIDEAAASTRLLSRNRFNLFAFHDRDQGPRDGSGLRPWVEGVLAGQGIALAGGRIRLLCLPRVLGYVFNPVGLYYCEHADGGLRAIVVQVHSTFGERHCYVLHAAGAAMDYACPHAKAKVFHVSPLLPRSGRYRFRFSEPGERIGLGIRLFPEGGSSPVFAMALVGHRHPPTTRNLLRLFLRIPLMTMKVTAAIHWQALKIWLRGGRLHRRPAQRYPDVS